MIRSRSMPVVVVVVALAGCFKNELTSTGVGYRNKPVDTSTTPEAPVAVAARVDQVGRQLVGQNPFLGVNPTFHTLSSKKLEIFHPDEHGVFVTDGLVDQCKTDSELAAVLASELGKMVAERRASDRMRLPEPLTTVQGAGNVSAGGVSSDQNQLGVQAVFDKQLTRPTRDRRPPSEDPSTVSLDILKSAGYEAGSLDAVAPLLQQAARNNEAAKQLGTRGNSPRWSN